MLKSSLPASNRKEIKKRKDMLHRANRRKPIVELHKYAGLTKSDAYDLFEDDEFDYNHWDEPHRSNMGGWEDIVYDRRDHDKLNHFIFWAWKRTRNLRVADRESHFKRLLGPNMLGWHAMQHTMSIIRPEYRWYYRDNPDGLDIPERMVDRGDNARRRKREANEAALLAELRVLSLDRKKLQKLNEYMKQRSEIQTQVWTNYRDATIAATNRERAGYVVVSITDESRANWGRFVVRYHLPLLQLHGKDDIYRFHRLITAQGKYNGWYNNRRYFDGICEHLGLK